MILKPEFERLTNTMGLTGIDLHIAEIVWSRCEKAMQQKPQQEAALLSDKSIFNLEAIKSETYADPYKLTQAELQTLTDGLSLVLTADEQQLRNIKTRIEQCWNKSNPDDKDSEVYFNMMNEYRTQQRKMKKAHKALARIQHKLKKKMGR